MEEQRWLTFDLFEGRVGEEFMASGEGVSATPMALVEATESAEPGGPGPEGEARLQFALVFRGPGHPVLPQATYRLQHPELGELDVFLVPMGPDPDGMRYEAAFA